MQGIYLFVHWLTNRLSFARQVCISQARWEMNNVSFQYGHHSQLFFSLSTSITWILVICSVYHLLVQAKSSGVMRHGLIVPDSQATLVRSVPDSRQCIIAVSVLARNGCDFWLFHQLLSHPALGRTTIANSIHRYRNSNTNSDRSKQTWCYLKWWPSCYIRGF